LAAVADVSKQLEGVTDEKKVAEILAEAAAKVEAYTDGLRRGVKALRNVYN